MNVTQDEYLAWGLTALFFVAGDLVTTAAGFAVGFLETNPLPAHVVETAGYAGLAPVKFAVVLAAVGLWLLASRLDPDAEYRWLVPTSLATFGLLITLNNAWVLYAGV